MNRELLKTEMERRKLTVTELSEMARINKSTLSRVLSGETDCTVSTAGKIANALKLSNKKTYQIFFGG